MFPSVKQNCHLLITAHKQSLRRICFYRCLSIHRGVCMSEGGVHGWGHVWQGDMCGGGVVGEGDMRGRGLCVVGACVAGGCAWQGGMHGRGVCVVGACMAGGVHGRRDMHGRHTPPQQILWDTVNERMVRILLECILVDNNFPVPSEGRSVLSLSLS